MCRVGLECARGMVWKICERNSYQFARCVCEVCVRGVCRVGLECVRGMVWKICERSVKCVFW